MTRPDLPNCRCKHWDGDNIYCPYHGSDSEDGFESGLPPAKFSDKQTENLGTLRTDNKTLRERFTANANEFDTLLSELLDKNTKQQERIDELGAHTDWLERHCLELMLLDSPTMDTLNERTQYLVNHSKPLSLTLIQRKAMQRCVEICEAVVDKHRTDYSNSASVNCIHREAGARLCANAIRKEMEGLSDEG